MVNLNLCSHQESSAVSVLPERRSLLSGLCYRKSVCRLSVTFVYPTQVLKLLAIFLHCCVTWPSSDLCAKFYGDRLRGTPPPDALDARGVANRAILDLSKAISHKRYTIRPRVQLVYKGSSRGV